MRSLFTRFFQLEAASGLLLIAAAVLALIINNSPLSYLYSGLLDVPVAVQVGALNIAKPLLLWINDGLMALFFLLIGLEVKREVVNGHLSKPSQIVLPATAAIGGMVVPALIYWFINREAPAAVAGNEDWAVRFDNTVKYNYGVRTESADKRLLGTPNSNDEQERQLSYWREKLGDDHAVLELPLDHSRVGAPSHRGARRELQVDPALAERLRALASAQGVTLFMVLLASFKLLLQRYSGQRAIRVGVPGQRHRPGRPGAPGSAVRAPGRGARTGSQQRAKPVVPGAVQPPGGHRRRRRQPASSTSWY